LGEKKLMKRKYLLVLTLLLTITFGGGYIFYKDLGKRPIVLSKHLIDTPSTDIPEIEDILAVRLTPSTPNIDQNKLPYLDPSNSEQKEVILKLLTDLHNVKNLSDEQPKGYPLRANWNLTINCKNGKSLVIHGNYSTKSVEQHDNNGNQTAVGMEYSPVPDEYLVRYQGKNEETKIYSRELSEWMTKNSKYLKP
jgi:hypothetical protein